MKQQQLFLSSHAQPRVSSVGIQHQSRIALKRADHNLSGILKVNYFSKQRQ
jgi:hypothetical protein